MGLRGPGALALKSRQIDAEKPKKARKRLDPWKKPGLSRAERVIAFCEDQKVAAGTFAKRKYRFREFQKAWIRRLYREGRKKKRIVRTAIKSVGRKNGKGLALDTPIPTPNGWTTMGQLKAGDLVYGADGKATKVRLVSEIHTGLRCWRLTFSDGSQIVADEDHQWQTTHSFRPWAQPRINSSGNGGRWVSEVVTTPQIAASVFRSRPDGGREHNHKISCAPALQSSPIELPVDPYLFGYWLGDGHSSSGRISAGDRDVDHLCTQISALGYSVFRRRDKTSWTVQTENRWQRGLGAQLRSMGMLNNKHIPEIYLNAGTEQRWALLQGLMDSDGTCSSAAVVRQCQFVSVSQRLARDTWRLLRSLGIKARVREGRAMLKGRDVGADYSITFNASAEQAVFRLARKQERLPERLKGRGKTLTVVACEEVESVPTRCISVEAEDRLYLAGHGCVVTHNTAEAALLSLCHLMGPEAEPYGEVYSAANDKNQAAKLFKEMDAILRMNPDLRARVNVIRFHKKIEVLSGDGEGSEYQALSADVENKDGLSPSFVVYDELGAAKNRTLYDLLDTAMGARDQPMMLVISTQAADDNAPMSELIDYGLRVKHGEIEDATFDLELYTTPPELDPWDEKNWYLSNPALGDFRSLDDVRRLARQAKQQRSKEPAFRNKILNQRVAAHIRFISRAEWKACEANYALEDFEGSVCFGGLDLSAVRDLTCLMLVFYKDGLVWLWPIFFMPEDAVAERAEEDRMPYDQWAKEGHIQLIPGATNDPAAIAKHIGELLARFKIKRIRYDRWKIKDLVRELDKADVPCKSDEDVEKDKQDQYNGVLLVRHGQGFQDMGPAVDDFETLVANRKIRHPKNPVLTMCAANAVTVQDPAGNRKLDKAKSTGRIDGMVAAVMAVRARFNAPGQKGQSIYATRGALRI